MSGKGPKQFMVEVDIGDEAGLKFSFEYTGEGLDDLFQTVKDLITRSFDMAIAISQEYRSESIVKVVKRKTDP